MFAKLFIPLYFIILFSCNTEQQKSIYLEKPVMAEIIAEMELAQAAYKYQANDQRFDLDFVFEEIYKKNNTSKDSFNLSLKFYSNSPKEMDEIYTETISVLNQKQADSIGK